MGLFSKWFGKQPEEAAPAQEPAVPAQPTVEVEALVVPAEPPSLPDPEPVAADPEPVAVEPDPEPVEPARTESAPAIEADVEPRVRAVSPQPSGDLSDADLEQRLTALLDALGSAHRKPFVSG